MSSEEPQQTITKTEIINNFVLGKQIGVGTFSKVRVAKHNLTNEQVVFKIIQKQKIINQADQNRLSRQLKIMRKVRHPNIIQLYEIIETSKYIYFVTEYAVRGELFEHIVSQQKLTQFEASKFLQQLLDAIEYIHQLGIAHRDLKPQNLLLDYKYNIKLADFGLSNIYAKNTKLNTACGSPCYAAPEMISGNPYEGLKADIWSIGIILYAMCFGYLPFDNQSTSELYNCIKNAQYEVPSHASEDLRDILKIILQKNPQKRASISQIRSHRFCQFSTYGSVPGIIVGLSEIPYEHHIQEQIRELGISSEGLRQAVRKNKHNDLTCMYYLLLQRYLRTQNKSITAYFSQKINIINRYNYVERVKEQVDRRIKQKQQIKKYKIVSEFTDNSRAKTTNKKGKGMLSSMKPKKVTFTEEKREKSRKRGKSLGKGIKLNF